MFEPILCVFNGFLSRFGKNILENRRNGKDKTKLIKLHYGALVMQVNGFQFQGKIYIALDEGSDYYQCYIAETLTVNRKIYGTLSLYDMLDPVLWGQRIFVLCFWGSLFCIFVVLYFVFLRQFTLFFCSK